jgi:hypothetical protein
MGVLVFASVYWHYNHELQCGLVSASKSYPEPYESSIHCKISHPIYLTHTLIL